MPRVADFIEANQQRLIARFLEEASRLPSAQGLPREEVLDSLDEYLATLAAVSLQGRRSDAVQTRERLEETHIGRRLRVGYNQEEVTREYLLLGRLLSSLWEELPAAEQPPAEDVQLLLAELQEAMDHAATVFTGDTHADQQREKRALRRLDALAPEALGEGTNPVPFEHRLAPLLEVVQEAMGADACALHLTVPDGKGLFLAAAVGVGREPTGSHRPTVGDDTFAGRVAAADETLHLADVASTPLGVREGVRRSGLRSLLGTRLWPNGRLLGVLTIGVMHLQPFTPRQRRSLETLAEYLAGIIDRARLFEEVRRQRDRYRTLLEAQDDLGEGVVITRAGRPVEVNDAFCAMSGGTREELLALPHLARRVVPEEREAVSRLLDALDRGGTDTARQELTLLHGSGRRVDVDVALKRLPDGSVISLHRDITEAKQARESLRQQMEAFRTLAQSMPQVVWTATAAGTVDFLNQRLAEYAGRSVEEMLAVGWDTLLHPANRPHVLEVWKRAVAAGQPYEVEQHLRRHDGVYRWFLTRGVPLRDAQGRVVRWLGTSTDIDDLKRAEAELRAHTAFERQLIGIVSHDLRSPVSALTLAAQLLQREGVRDDQRRIVARMLSSAERANRLIRDLLDFTKARLGGGIPVERTQVDLHRLARLVVEEVQMVHPERHLDLDARGEAFVMGDADRLAQVLTNLLSNALAYSPPGTPVWVRVREEPQDTLLEVSNQGTPIPPEQLARVFQPLERGARAPNKGGRSIGLGLFIVDHIVRAHGGTIEVRSTAEEGTTFTVRLPRATA